VRAETRLRAGSAWEILTSTFNGMVFLLLGLQVPALAQRGARVNAATGTASWHLPLVIVGVTGALILLRLVWIILSLAITRVFTRIRHQPFHLPSARLITAMAIAGVRGAVTLAAVLSLAAGFPQRDLLVTVAAGVIVCSLIVASIGLPWLLSGSASSAADPVQAEVEGARIAILRAASGMLERELAAPAIHGGSEEERKEVITRILADLQSRIQHQMLMVSPGESDLEEKERRNAHSVVRRRRLEMALRLRVLRVERDELEKMTKSLEINNETERRLTHELDRFEEVLLGMTQSLPLRVG
jgi:CPA1 family monovalent cation:H+ antiporter